MLLKTTGLFSLLLLIPAAQAATSCEQANTQSAMNECAASAYKKSDAELNRVYKEVRAGLKDNKQMTDKLVKAQRAWVTFRDAECGFQAARTTGGSVHAMVVSMCLDDVTRTRTQALEKQLKCEEGDLSCAIPQS